MEITVSISKNYEKVMDLLEATPKILKKMAVIGGEEIAQIGLIQLKDHIDKQDLPWKALSKQWKAYKLNSGLSGKIYEATGEFKDKLTYRKDSTRNVWRVGAFGDIKHKFSGLSMNRLATILEYGNDVAGIPARPLFRPTQRELSTLIRNYVKTVKQRLSKIIKEELRR